MKDEKYPIDEDKRSKKRLRIEREKYEETQKEEKKKIQKDKIIDEEESGPPRRPPDAVRPRGRGRLHRHLQPGRRARFPRPQRQRHGQGGGRY